LSHPTRAYVGDQERPKVRRHKVELAHYNSDFPPSHHLLIAHFTPKIVLKHRSQFISNPHNSNLSVMESDSHIKNKEPQDANTDQLLNEGFSRQALIEDM
jgi:hypothetical protein